MCTACHDALHRVEGACAFLKKLKTRQAGGVEMSSEQAAVTSTDEAAEEAPREDARAPALSADDDETAPVPMRDLPALQSDDAQTAAERQMVTDVTRVSRLGEVNQGDCGDDDQRLYESGDENSQGNAPREANGE
jgi:hypothetical protein